MSKPKLLKLNENYISPYLSHYHSESEYNGRIKEYDFVSRNNFMSAKPEKLSQPYINQMRYPSLSKTKTNQNYFSSRSFDTLSIIMSFPHQLDSLKSMKISNPQLFVNCTKELDTPMTKLKSTKSYYHPTQLSDCQTNKSHLFLLRSMILSNRNNIWKAQKILHTSGLMLTTQNTSLKTDISKTISCLN